MPPRIRTRATTKDQKENNNVENIRSKRKIVTNVRKALTDKTNSLSDDNKSIEVPETVVKNTNVTSKKKILKSVAEIEKARPRRKRRLPSRYVENNLLNNLSNSKDNAGGLSPKTSEQTPVPNKIGHRNGVVKKHFLSPFKSSLINVDTSLIIDRPKRICRLPSKYEDHSISPNKFIPVKPCHASTPIVQKSSKDTSDNAQCNDNTQLGKKKVSEPCDNTTSKVKPSRPAVQSSKTRKRVTIQKRLDEYVDKKLSPDTNNNPKQTRSVRNKKLIEKNKSSVQSPKLSKIGKRFLNKSLSFKILEDNEKDKNHDVYEFTFDPNEEPTPKKKKRKRVVKKKAVQPKPVYKNTYDKNVSKALAALKTAVSKKAGHSEVKEVNKLTQIVETQNECKSTQQNVQDLVENVCETVNTKSDNIQKNNKIIDTTKPSTSGALNHYAIASSCSPVYEDNIDFDHDEIDVNYSPVHTVDKSKTPENILENNPQDVIHEDPLNLRDDLSFFDSQPVASSSLNVSAKHPLASPWRVEFEKLPIKWQVNSYVKPNMTPAVECSFINTGDEVNKKHVYTNMVPLSDDTLPQVIDDEPSYKQTSIMSFIKEVAEKQAMKKLHKSPRKANSLFEDITNTTSIFEVHTPKIQRKKNVSDGEKSNSRTSKDSSNMSNDKENYVTRKKRKNSDKTDSVPAKSPCMEKEKDCTYFGFEDSENQDENKSPVKNRSKKSVKALRSRSRGVLNEINGPKGPFRPVLPVAFKSNALFGSEAVNKIYENLKSAADAPVFKEQEPNKLKKNNVQSQNISNDDESQSVHLFEDIDIVHHLKPTRKSYGKAKKVTFRQQSVSDSDIESTQAAAVERESSFEDDLADLSFHMPEVKEKKTSKKRQTKKKLMSKKEEKEAENWAAGFNSMCEDIEKFTLLVE